MVRKAKSTTVKKIERLFTDTGNAEMSFGEIASSVGVGTNKLVGTLTSNPRLFEKTKTQRRCHDDAKVTVTFWRHIPEKSVGIDRCCDCFIIGSFVFSCCFNVFSFGFNHRGFSFRFGRFFVISKSHFSNHFNSD